MRLRTFRPLRSTTHNLTVVAFFVLGCYQVLGDTAVAAETNSTNTAPVTSGLTGTSPVETGSSPKKGFGVVVHTDRVWLQEVTALKVHWFYSWGGDEPAEMPNGVEFVPMDWGYYGNNNNSLVDWIARVKAQPNVHYILGFNEPDHADQSNLTPAKALEGWPYIQQSGLILGAPAAANADQAWMQQFMDGVEQNHYQVDFIPVHWYGHANPAELLVFLDRVHKLYNRPIWITEFAPADWTGHRLVTPQQAADFMRAVIPALNKLEYVQRYAWYSDSTDSDTLGDSALFNKDGSLTDLGQLYASY